jgi:biopolymer transport protein TolR
MIALPKRARPDTNADINIVPYIDVMLVLLVIFMMTTPIIEQGMEVELPKGPATPLDYSDGPQPTVISIDDNNNYYINSLLDDSMEQIGDTDPLKINDIVNRMIARMNENPNRAVVIKGDRSSDYGVVYNLMLELKSLGIDKVSFSSENPN